MPLAMLPRPLLAPGATCAPRPPLRAPPLRVAVPATATATATALRVGLGPRPFPVPARAFHAAPIRCDAPRRPSPPQSSFSEAKERKTGFFHSFKSVCIFYFRGMKQIAWNWQTASMLRRAARKTTPKYELTRQDWHLIRLSRRDMLKIPHMLLLIIVLEELLPVLVVFFPRAIPSPCHVPSQVEQAFEDQEVKLAEAHRLLTEKPLAVNEQGKVENWQLVQLATLFGLPTWGSHQRIINRLVAHQKFLTGDDIALLSSSVDHPQPKPELLDRWISQHPSAEARALALGNSVPTTGPELARACRQRGLRSLGMPDAELQRTLDAWLDQVAPFPAEMSDAERVVSLAQRAFSLWRTEGMDEVQARVQERQKLGFFKRTKGIIQGIVDAGSQPPPPPPGVVPPKHE